MPLAGVFPTEAEKGREELYPLDVWWCPKCSVLQTSTVIDADTLFLDYRYRSSVGLSAHFEGLADMMIGRHSLDGDSVVVEVGSNDGVFLVPMKERGIEAIGFEPARNIATIAKERGGNVVNDYFNKDTALEHVGEAKADMVVACNCMAHVPPLKEVVAGIGAVLKDGAVAVVEVQYVRSLIDKMQYDFIYHEHCYYHSIKSMSVLFELEGMGLATVEHTPIHGGSIRLTYRKGAAPVRELLDEEEQAGLYDFKYYESFGDKVRAHMQACKKAMAELRSKGTVAGYGASGRANILTSMCEMSQGEVFYIVDDSPERAGRFTAKTHIPIVSPDVLRESAPKSLVIFAWTYAEMIKKKVEDLGVDCYVLFPEFARC
jgi:SAM-dependent methyltransferase